MALCGCRPEPRNMQQTTTCWYFLLVWSYTQGCTPPKPPAHIGAVPGQLSQVKSPAGPKQPLLDLRNGGRAVTLKPHAAAIPWPKPAPCSTKRLHHLMDTARATSCKQSRCTFNCTTQRATVNCQGLGHPTGELASTFLGQGVQMSSLLQYPDLPSSPSHLLFVEELASKVQHGLPYLPQSGSFCTHTPVAAV